MKRGKKFYNNGEIEICLEDNQDIPEGFIKGRLFKDNVYIFKGTLSKRIKKEFLDQYLKEGWRKGRAKFSDQAIENIRNSRKRFFDNNPHWTGPTTWKRGQKAWNKGKPMKESTKRKLSESHTGKHLSTEKRIERNKKRVFNKEKE